MRRGWMSDVARWYGKMDAVVAWWNDSVVVVRCMVVWRDVVAEDRRPHHTLAPGPWHERLV